MVEIRRRLRRNKGKGKQFERDLRDIIRAHTGLGEGDVDSAVGCVTGIDILLSPAARKVFPYSVECKARSSGDVEKWVDQAERNAYPGTVPICAWKPNKKGPNSSLVIMRIQDFLNLMPVEKKDEKV